MTTAVAEPETDSLASVASDDSTPEIAPADFPSDVADDVADQVRSTVETVLRRGLVGLEYISLDDPQPGSTPKDTILSEGSMKLYHYRPQDGRGLPPPAAGDHLARQQAVHPRPHAGSEHGRVPRRAGLRRLPDRLGRAAARGEFAHPRRLRAVAHPGLHRTDQAGFRRVRTEHPWLLPGRHPGHALPGQPPDARFATLPASRPP